MTKISEIEYESCILCGDNVEIKSHRVCFWHAVCIKNDDGLPKYVEESRYVMEQYSDLSVIIENNETPKIVKIYTPEENIIEELKDFANLKF